MKRKTPVGPFLLWVSATTAVGEYLDKVMTFGELGHELNKLGTPEDRVKVLDVDHSATTYQLPQIEARVRVGTFYLRAPKGVSIDEMKALFEKCDAAFRYKVTSGIGTDHVELLTPDEYARQNFSSAVKLIHLEGARKLAREQLEEIFDAMKAEFDPAQFPHLEEVVISGFKEGSDELSAEVKLLAYDGDYRNMSRLERDITRRLTEGNLLREIDVGRHLVKDTKPEIILGSTAKATIKGKQFLRDLAAFLLTRDGGIQMEAFRDTATKLDMLVPTVNKSAAKAFPRIHAPVKTPAEIVNQAINQFATTLAGMSAYKDLEIKKIPQGIHVQFSKNLFSGARFEARELTQLNGVHKAILGSPGLHDGWKAFYIYDKKERLLKLRFTTPDQELDRPWSLLPSRD